MIIRFLETFENAATYTYISTRKKSTYVTGDKFEYVTVWVQLANTVHVVLL